MPYHQAKQYKEDKKDNGPMWEKFFFIMFYVHRLNLFG
jgi:hypothetical protein